MGMAAEDDWADLIDFAVEGDVVPIVGPALLDCSLDGGPPQNFYTLVASELAKQLRLDEPLARGVSALNEVGCRALRELRQRPEELCPKVSRIVRRLEERVTLPEALVHLTALPARLFVSTTVDNLLVRAIEQRNPAWKGCVISRDYSPKHPDDLRELDSPAHAPPRVFQLFGRAQSAPEWVLTEEDALEFMHALQSSERRPEALFRLLHQKNLLILGCGFPDWLARFFIRLGKRDRFINESGKTDWVVDAAGAGPELGAFLGHFSRLTRLCPMAPADFVAELSRRLPSGPARRRADADESLQGQVFLSYASEDRAVVERLKRELDDAGIDCWFDREQLEGGDQWEAKIEQNVRACSAFVPVVSRHTLTAADRYFRLEWHEAIERMRRLPANRTFLLPIALDATNPDAPELDPGIRQLHWERMANGHVPFSFVERVKEAVRQAQLSQREAHALL